MNQNELPTPTQNVQKRRRFYIPDFVKVLWSPIRGIMIWVVSLCLVFVIANTAYQYLYEAYFSPTDVEDTTLVPIYISRGSGISKIATALKEANLIHNEGVFKYYADFTNRSTKLQYGEYVFQRTMDLDHIIDLLTIGDGNPVTTLTMFIPEGYTVEQIADKLVKDGILNETKTFLDLCRTGDAFISYDIVRQLLETGNLEGRTYALEGYLFPDTYEVYSDATPQQIISKMLTRCENILKNGKHIESAEKLNMTVDQLLTLASIIEKEGKSGDFSKVSAVFHNRLAANMALGADATVKYVIKTKRLSLSALDLRVDSPYNTYVNRGLPIGPIANPGAKAMFAAVMPDQAFVEQQYLYFLVANPTDEHMLFYKTYEEHQAAAAEYRPLWEEYDRTHNNQ